MTLFQAIILAIVQGLTEFLPISSSAHLVLVPALLGWSITPGAAVLFGVSLHFGTLLAVVIYFAHDLLWLLKALVLSFDRRRQFGPEEKTYIRLAWWIVIGTIPVVLIALLFKDRIESAFSAPLLAAIFLLVTGVYLVLADFFSKPTRALGELRLPGALTIGLAQAVSLLPGISRSGSTIATGMFFGLKREEAARFSFLLSVPAVLGAFILEVISIPLAGLSWWIILLGVVLSCGVGLLCIHFFLQFLKRSRLVWFAIYCWVFGLFAIFKLLLG